MYFVSLLCLVSFLAQTVPTQPVVAPESTNALIWIALITMIGSAIKQYLDNRKVLAELELSSRRSLASDVRTEQVAATLKSDTKQAAAALAVKAEELHSDIKVIKIEVNDRLTQLLAAKDLASDIRAAAAHAAGQIEGREFREKNPRIGDPGTVAHAAAATSSDPGLATGLSSVAANTAATAANTAALDANTQGRAAAK